MSAFLVSRAHVDVLVRLAISGAADAEPAARRLDFPARVKDESGRWRRVAPVDDLQHADLIDPSEVGRILWAENAASVEHRYNEPAGNPDEEYVYTDPGFAPTSAEAAKALVCIEFQSCEHPGWAGSTAFGIVQVLRSAVLASLPGTDRAPWAWGASDVAARRGRGTGR